MLYNGNTGQELLTSLQLQTPSLTADSLLHLGFTSLEPKMHLGNCHFQLYMEGEEHQL
jgi:hypothetical protein